MISKSPLAVAEWLSRSPSPLFVRDAGPRAGVFAYELSLVSFTSTN